MPPREETYTVSQLGEELRSVVAAAFDSVWVEGEVARARRHARGHLYFELLEKGEGDAIAGRLDGVVWRSELERVERAFQRLGLEVGIADGRHVRLRIAVDFYPPSGRIQAVVREVDAAWSLGDLARRRRETLTALEEAGLLDRQAGLAFPLLPLSIGLITSEGSAAYHDFLATLRESGFAFQVRFAHAAVQGARAEAEIADGLKRLSLASSGCDLVVLVRGGGGRADLSIFDGRRLAEAIARCPLPVLTGLGHEIDESVADRVAHRSAKTPTKAAEILVAAAREVFDRLEDRRSRLRRSALRLLERSVAALAGAHRGLRLGGARLRESRLRLDALARALAREASAGVRLELRANAEREARLRRAADRRVEPAAHSLVLLARRLASAPALSVSRRGERLRGLARLAESARPERILRRGFSITRHRDGSLLRDASTAVAGSELVTELERGIVESRVIER